MTSLSPLSPMSSVSGHVMWRAVTTLLYLLLTTSSTRGQSGEYCDTEVFRAECPEGAVILLDKARYGRMRIGRCVELDLGYIGCFSDVLSIADRRCSGKRVCEIRIPDAEFESTRPCLKELKTYLEASYRCVAVETITTEYCRANDELNTTSTSGYIASVVTSDTPYCDGSSHPWVIRASPGQHINLTLYDFALDRLSVAKQQSTEPVDLELPCQQYGLIEDNQRDKPYAICSGRTRRVSMIYRSVGHVVKIWVTAGSAPKDMKRFVIYYTVTGCPEPEIPEHSWFRRTEDDNGLVGCQYSSVTWSIRCVDNSWVTQAFNCTPAPAAGDDVITDDPPAMPYVVTFGVVAGVLVCLVVMLLLIVFIKQCRRQQTSRGQCDALLFKRHAADNTDLAVRGSALPNRQPLHCSPRPTDRHDHSLLTEPLIAGVTKLPSDGDHEQNGNDYGQRATCPAIRQHNGTAATAAQHIAASYGQRSTSDASLCTTFKMDNRRAAADGQGTGDIVLGGTAIRNWDDELGVTSSVKKQSGASGANRNMNIV